METAYKDFKPYYAICSGKQGKLFTLRYFYLHEGYDGELDIWSKHVTTLTGDLEASKEKARRLGYDKFEIHVTSVAPVAEKTKINHSIMPFGKFMNTPFMEIPAESLCSTVNGGYLNGTKYVKEKQFAIEALKAADCIFRKENINQRSMDNFVTATPDEKQQYWNNEVPQPEYQSFWRSPEYLQKEIDLQKQKEEREQKKALSQYVGNPGDKISFSGVIAFRKSFPTQFGTSNIVKIIDAENNAYTYFGNSIGEEKGARVNVTATVKKHEEYQGEKSTHILRPKVTLMESSLVDKILLEADIHI